MGTVNIRTDILQNMAEGLGDFLSEYQTVVRIFYIFAVVTVFIIMIINVTKLAQAGDNPQKRSEAIHGILITGICIAILGSIGFVYVLLISFLL